MNTPVWGWDGIIWRKVLLDAAGHLQVDVVAAPAFVSHCYGYNGGAWQRLRVESAANANLRARLYDGVNAIISTGTGADIADTNRGLLTQAVLRGWDGAFFKAVNVEDGAGDALVNARASLSSVSKLYGYNGATWDRLRVESNVAFNLRVKLYDGANGVNAGTALAAYGVGEYGLDTRSLLYGISVTTVAPAAIWSRLPDDNLAPQESLFVWAQLAGFDGATWDRLRSYGTGILKVGRAEVGLLTARLVAVGQVGAAGVRRLYWMLLNPSAGNSLVELADAAAPGGAVVADHFDTARDGHMLTFDPPMEFTTGLYLETFTNMTSITFGYL